MLEEKANHLLYKMRELCGEYINATYRKYKNHCVLEFRGEGNAYSGFETLSITETYGSDTLELNYDNGSLYPNQYNRAYFECEMDNIENALTEIMTNVGFLRVHTDCTFKKSAYYKG